jgi:tetratricopeptide (TPR) repeat protein
LLGYASRKLGRYDDAKYWYDKALAADPNHALTWLRHVACRAG